MGDLEIEEIKEDEDEGIYTGLDTFVENELDVNLPFQDSY